MNSKQFHRRVWAMVLLLALMVTGMGAALYDLQVNNGDSYYQQTQKKIAESQTVQAARGQILDRNGQVLVSNKVIYQVTLDTKLMGDQRNSVILALIQAARAENVEWVDNLPVSQTAPFSFVGASQPYYTVSHGEDGTTTRNLTRLGRLAVKMKWIADPTVKLEREVPAEPEEPGLGDKIKSFFGIGKKEAAPAAPKSPEPLPNARQLLGRMCDSFSVKGEGAVDKKEAEKTGQSVPELNIGDMSETDARAMAGVLYELYLRSKEVYIATEYIFASDVGIDFISRVKELDLPGVVIEATTVRQYHTQYAAHLLGRVTSIYPDEVDYYTSLDLDGDGVGDYKMNDTVQIWQATRRWNRSTASWLRPKKAALRLLSGNAADGCPLSSSRGSFLRSSTILSGAQAGGPPAGGFHRAFHCWRWHASCSEFFACTAAKKWREAAGLFCPATAFRRRRSSLPWRRTTGSGARGRRELPTRWR